MKECTFKPKVNPMVKIKGIGVSNKQGEEIINLAKETVQAGES
jgi:hypothetical protein